MKNLVSPKPVESIGLVDHLLTPPPPPCDLVPAFTAVTVSVRFPCIPSLALIERWTLLSAASCGVVVSTDLRGPSMAPSVNTSRHIVHGRTVVIAFCDWRTAAGTDERTGVAPATPAGQWNTGAVETHHAPGRRAEREGCVKKGRGRRGGGHAAAHCFCSSFRCSSFR